MPKQLYARTQFCGWRFDHPLTAEAVNALAAFSDGYDY